MSLQDWMSRLNDDLRLVEMKIPGTHNSVADCAIESSSMLGRFGSIVAQCQGLDLVSQLERGIRYFDIRLKLDDFELRVYHGPCLCGHTFSEVLLLFARFLSDFPSEFLIVEIHREDSKLSTRRSISDANFMDVVNHTLEMIRQFIFESDSANPTIGELRQKILLVSFKHIENAQSLLNYRIFPIRKNYDSYRCSATDSGKAKKMRAIAEGMSHSLECEELFVNETNAVGSIPILAFVPNPRRMAEMINEELEGMIERPFRGVIEMDFPELTKSGRLIEKIVELNFGR
jgi:hypothetical protein